MAGNQDCSMSSAEENLELVNSSVKDVMHCDEEVNCQKDGPDSLKAISDYFSFTDPATYRALADFCSTLLQAMQFIIIDRSKVKFRHFHEESLINFQKLKTERLPLIWQSLSTALKLPPVNPFQMQAVNRHLFQEVLIHYSSLSTVNAQPIPPPTPRTLLTIKDENAIRYAGGYVAMKLLNKMKAANVSKFIECLSHMASSGEESSFNDYTLDWMTRIDQGGLMHINDTAFCFYRAIELKTHEHLSCHLAVKADKSDLLNKITEDDEVQFWWSMVSIDVPDEDGGAELLNEIVHMWVTIRGFAIVSNWLEQYKVAQKQSLKKSKSLRKKLT